MGGSDTASANACVRESSVDASAVGAQPETSSLARSEYRESPPTHVGLKPQASLRATAPRPASPRPKPNTPQPANPPHSLLLDARAHVRRRRRVNDPAQLRDHGGPHARGRGRQQPLCQQPQLRREGTKVGLRGFRSG